MQPSHGSTGLLHEQIAAFIAAQRAAQPVDFLPDVDLADYVQKLLSRAEINMVLDRGRVQGLVAYYCNDQETKEAYISLIVVASEARGAGLGRALIEHVVSQATQRRFNTCALELVRGNHAAQRFYEKLGFAVVSEGPVKKRMQRTL